MIKNELLKSDIIENYVKFGPKYFSEKYQCKVGRIHTLACKLGVTCNKRWNSEKKFIINEYLDGATLDELALKYKHYEGSIKQKLNEWGIKVRTSSEANRKYLINEGFFEKIDSHEKAYFLGFLYADGNVNINTKNSKSAIQIALKDNDSYILEYFYQIMGTEPRLYKDRKSKRLIINSIKMCADVAKLGLLPRKSFTLKFPGEEMVSSEFIGSFLLGYFDGDGSLSICKDQRWAFSMISSRSFCEGVRDCIFKELGFILPIYDDKRHPGISSVVLGQSKEGFGKLKVIHDFMYKNQKKFLTRKKDRFRKVLNLDVE